jgi:hypothetical protein
MMLIVVVPTAGLASVLLGWLIHFRVTDSDLEGAGWAFYLDEGTKQEGSRTSARLTGLTISSLAVSQN